MTEKRKEYPSKQRDRLLKGFIQKGMSISTILEITKEMEGKTPEEVEKIATRLNEMYHF